MKVYSLGFFQLWIKSKKARINSVHIRHKIGGGEFSWWPLFISRDTVRSAMNKGSVVGAPYLSLTFSVREEFSSGFALRGAPFCDSQFVELKAPRSGLDGQTLFDNRLECVTKLPRRIRTVACHIPEQRHVSGEVASRLFFSSLGVRETPGLSAFNHSRVCNSGPDGRLLLLSYLSRHTSFVSIERKSIE